MGDTRFSSEKFEKLCIVIIAILFFIVVFKTITSPKKIYTVSLPEKTVQGTLAVTAIGDKVLPEIVSFISPSGKITIMVSQCFRLCILQICLFLLRTPYRRVPRASLRIQWHDNRQKPYEFLLRCS